MNTEKTMQDLNRFLAASDVIKIETAVVAERVDEIFGSKTGQKMLSLSLEVFNKALKEQLKEKKETSENDRVNILCRIFTVLEEVGYIKINIKKNYARNKTKTTNP